MKVLLIGGERNGRQIEIGDSYMPYLRVLRTPDWHGTDVGGRYGRLGDGDDPLPFVTFPDDTYVSQRLTNGTIVYVEKTRSFAMHNLWCKAQSLRGTAKRYSLDADELGSRVLAEMAHDVLIEARICEAKAQDLLRPEVAFEHQ